MVPGAAFEEVGKDNLCLGIKTTLKLHWDPTELSQIAPRQQPGRKTHNLGSQDHSGPGVFREVSCDAPWHWFASRSALCYKDDGDGDLPAGNWCCSV